VNTTSGLGQLATVVTRLWRLLIKTRPGQITIAALTLCTSISLGAVFGYNHSPRYQSAAAAVIFLGNHFEVLSVDQGDAVLFVRAGIYEYKYSLKENKVVKSVAVPDGLLNQPLPDRWSDEELKRYRELFAAFGEPLAVAVGASAMLARWQTTVDRAFRPIAKATGPLGQGERYLIYFGVGVVGATGGYLGYLITYDPKMHLDNEVMVRTLMDADSWEAFAKLIHGCNDTRDYESAVAQNCRQVLASVHARRTSK
jgi:hypothetical protein